MWLEPVPSSARPQRSRNILPFLICACVAGLATATVVCAEDTKAQILEAWKKRTATIKSFQVQVNLKTTEPVAVSGKTNVTDFGEPVDENSRIEDVVLQSKLTLRIAKDKLALRNAGQKWNESYKAISTGDFQACFDGRREMTLLDGKFFAHGLIHLQQDLQFSQIRNVRFFDFWLWYSPIAKLEMHGYESAHMEVIPGKLEHNGVECIELKIPRSNGKQVGYLYVDPARDYLPIRFVVQYKGAITRECDIWYSPNKDVGWTISKFFDKHFDNPGKFRESYAGDVQRVSINEPINDKLFTLEFPPGTQITEQDGENRKYYIQEADGKRREIPESEYGRIPDDDDTA